MAATMSSMQVEQAVLERLNSLAKAEGRSVSQIIASLLDEHERRQRSTAADELAALTEELGLY